MKKQINNSIQRKELLTVVSKYIGVLIFPIAEYKLNVAKKFQNIEITIFEILMKRKWKGF